MIVRSGNPAASKDHSRRHRWLSRTAPSRRTCLRNEGIVERRRRLLRPTRCRHYFSSRESCLGRYGRSRLPSFNRFAHTEYRSGADGTNTTIVSRADLIESRIPERRAPSRVLPRLECRSLAKHSPVSRDDQGLGPSILPERRACPCDLMAG